MRLNKVGKADITTLVIVGLIIAAGYMWYTNSQTGGSSPVPLAPSDLKTSLEIYSSDALATTPTAAQVGYTLFKSSGEFYKEGLTGSDGKDSVDVQYGASYKLLAFNDSAATSGTGFLSEEKDFTADSGEGSVKTISVKLYQVGGLQVVDARDPVDLNGNISCSAGQSSDFEVLWKVNVSNSAILNPTIVVDGNQTGIDADGITISGFTENTCPSRLTTGSGRRKWCFIKSGIVKSADGVQSTTGSVKFDDTTAPGCAGGTQLEIFMIDQQMYKEPDYQTAGRSAFKIGWQDKAQTDVGSVDSTSDTVGFGG